MLCCLLFPFNRAWHVNQSVFDVRKTSWQKRKYSTDNVRNGSVIKKNKKKQKKQTYAHIGVIGRSSLLPTVAYWRHTFRSRDFRRDRGRRAKYFESKQLYKSLGSKFSTFSIFLKPSITVIESHMDLHDNKVNAFRYTYLCMLVSCQI